MNILADESIDGPIVYRLRDDGHSVDFIAEINPSIPDIDVLSIAHETRRLLITADKDFGELVMREEREHSGVILVRLFGLSPMGKGVFVSEIINKYGDDLLNAFTVISRDSIRIRHSHE